MFPLFFLLCGVLPGTNAKTVVKILPELQRAVTWKSRHPLVTMYDLTGKPVAKLTLEGIPGYCCEVSEFIFITFVDENNQIHLIRTDANFRGTRVAKNMSLYYPSKLNGKYYGLNMSQYLQSEQEFSRLAASFDPKSIAFGDHRLFKQPHEISKAFAPRAYWLFTSGDNIIAIYANSRYIYILDKAYQMREAAESDKVAGTPPSILLDLPGGFQNYGPFKPTHALSAEDAQQKYREWFMGQTQVFLAWRSKQGELYISFGEPGTKATKVARLDGSYKLEMIASYPDILAGAQDKSIWFTDRLEEIVLRTVELP